MVGNRSATEHIRILRMQRRPGSQLSLGAACWGWPAAPHTWAPDDSAPGSWQALFLSPQHADAATLSGIFTMCRAGRDMVLQSSRTVRLRLKMSAIRSQSLPRLSQALLTRGSLPVALTVQWDNHVASSEGAVLLAGFLLAVGSAVRELAIHASVDPNSAAIAQFLQHTATACPALSRLQLKHCTPTLPPPAALPTLIHVDVAANNHAQAFSASLGLLLPQLHSLVFSRHQLGVPPPWAALFSPATAAQQLTQLSTTGPLTDELLGLLLDHAPALRRLTVADVGRVTGQHRDRQWGLQRLTTSVAQLEALMQLPVSTAGPVKVCSTANLLTVRATTRQGMDADLLDHIAGWRIQCKRVRMDLDGSMPAADRHAAFNAMLQQLGELLQPGVPAELQAGCWQWTAELSDAFTAAAAASSSGGGGGSGGHGGTQHRLLPPTRLLQPLTDALLGMVLATGAHMPSLSVPSLALQSDQHAAAAWPWHELSVETVDVADLRKLPGNSWPSTRRIRCRVLVLSSLQQASLGSYKVSLKNVEWAGSSDLTIQLHSTPDTTLHTQLSVLATADLSVLNTVALVGYALTPTTMDALQGLPKCARALDLTACTWPLQPPAPYSKLAQLVPGCYTKWLLGDRVPGEVRQELQAGVSERGKEYTSTVQLVYGLL